MERTDINKVITIMGEEIKAMQNYLNSNETLDKDIRKSLELQLRGMINLSNTVSKELLAVK